MAARETDALQEAKDKLQAQVEDLTWRLQLEKRLKTDLEEAKGQEILKLQNSLQAVQAKVDEINALLVKERESAQKAIEEASTIVREPVPIHVEDTEKIDKLSAEVDELKKLLESERNRANESEKKCTEALETSEVKQQKLKETINRANQFQNSMNRLEEKLTNIESENKVLHQQDLTMAQSTKLQVARSKSTRRTESTKSTTPVEKDLHSPSMQMRDADVEERPQKSLNEKQQEYQDLLIRCLRQWRSFEVEKTNIFDRITQTIGQAIETQDNNNLLAYWLSNASTLLLLLQCTLKASGTAGAPQLQCTTSSTLSGRTTQSFCRTPQDVNISLIDGETDGGSDTLQQVEAKSPALIFKQQLTAYVEKIYGMLRDNIKKEISPLLGLCIQAPRICRVNMLARCPSRGFQIAYWQGIVNNIGCFLNMLKSNNVPPFLVRNIFTQLFSFINVQLFNSVLLRTESRSFCNGEYVNAGLSELERWCYKATEEYVGSAWDELKHIRQATGFLVIHEKPKKTLDEISHDLCPLLSIQQLYIISTTDWDEKYSLSRDVISKMRVLMTQDSNNAVSSSFLLDDDSSIPVDKISQWIKKVSNFDIDVNGIKV
ncbi:hypothetical protein L2E82_13057 [Cichorium intybus]|uniref:Uncharacterized protein n=1 Tax=Cichorium intybus TaxID=13427 RepID=A0ACB9GJ17_CICIN|nr:hypothetical protein L2E82_13057 [Cichorium intybus]